MMRTKSMSLLFVCVAWGCGGGDGSPDSSPDAAEIPDARIIADADLSPDGPLMPELLSQTGLYRDIASGTLRGGVREYEPAYELWSDGATKRRFIYLPPGTTIDTANMDFWEFPVGTKLWKEFTRDGVRVETRLLYKNGPSDWYMTSYLWNDDESDAVAMPGGQENARGTQHDVPLQIECLQCHAGVTDMALGFSALQLDHDKPGVNLKTLIAEGLLSSPPAGSAPPYFPLPGDTTAKAALGYLHGNCGGCHNPRAMNDEVNIQLRLSVFQLNTVESTPPFLSTVGVMPLRTPPPGSTAIIEPGNPDASALYLRMSSRGFEYSMPPVSTDIMDEKGAAALRAWIGSLSPRLAGHVEPAAAETGAGAHDH